ncbi:MAG: cation:proton antiporter [Rubripirellula sp.]
MTQTLIHDLLIILASGLVASVLCRWMRVSVLIGYLVVGVVIGQGVLGWIVDEDHQIGHFAEAGVFLLLFSIGLEFSLDDIRRLGREMIIGGSLQMGLVAFPIMIVLYQLGISWQASVLLAFAIAFSSTVLVFKALSESGQSELSHGRRAIGILLFQDAALVPLLLIVPMLMGHAPAAVTATAVDAAEAAALDGEFATGANAYLLTAGISVLFVLAIVGLRYTLGRWLIPMMARFRSPEMVTLFTVVSIGGVTLGAHTVGLPPTVGAFAAGLIFNGNRWTRQIDSLVLPFRETFSAIFFVGLGLIFKPSSVLAEPFVFIAMLGSVIAIKTVAAGVALRFTGLPTRKAFGMGLGLAHIGEFAFVLLLQGLESGVVSELNYERLISVAIGSLVLTPPLMRFGLRFVNQGEEEASAPNTEIQRISSDKATVIGAGPTGRQMASQLETLGRDVCLVDLSPINLHPFALEGFRTVAGDATRNETLEFANAFDSVIVAICVPSDDVAVRIVRAIRKGHGDGTLIVRCRYHASVQRLKRVGADCVVSEENEAAVALMKIIERVGRTHETAT